MKHQFVIYIGATPEKVWESLVSPEGTKAIFFGSVLESTFEAGSSYEYVGPGADGDRTVHVYGTILEIEPGRVFSALEHPGPSYNPKHEELESRITITLEKVGETTKATLVNDNWTENHPSFESAGESWPMILSSLKTYSESGRALDFGW